MTEIEQQAKVNGSGRDCPEWCTVDHNEPDSSFRCVDRVARIGTGDRQGENWRGGADVEQPAYPADAEPEVRAYLFAREQTGIARGNASIYAGRPYEAETMAQFLDMAAQAKPSELRQLAAEVRKAQAIAWPTEAEAE